MNKFQLLNDIQRQLVKSGDEWLVFYDGLYLGHIETKIKDGKKFYLSHALQSGGGISKSFMGSLALIIDADVIKTRIKLRQKERDAMAVNCVHQFITRGRKKTFLEKVKGWFK